VTQSSTLQLTIVEDQSSSGVDGRACRHLNNVDHFVSIFLQIFW